MKDAIVIIPTRGLAVLRKAVESVTGQADVLLVTDSVEDQIELDELDLRGVDWLHFPYKIAGGQWSGHRIYAAVPHIVNHEYVFFLDEDNWYEPNHVRTMIEAMGQSGVAYSFRNIVDTDGTFGCKDECESLGPRMNMSGRQLIDTSCYGFRNVWIRARCASWDFAWGADARFCQRWCAEAKGTGQYTVNYRVGGATGQSVESFKQGNAVMRLR